MAEDRPLSPAAAAAIEQAVADGLKRMAAGPVRRRARRAATRQQEADRIAGRAAAVVRVPAPGPRVVPPVAAGRRGRLKPSPLVLGGADRDE